MVRGVHSDRGDYYAPKVLLATGGASYPLTGSTGDGLKFAKQAGHTVTECRPSLVPLESPDAYCEQMQGFSLRNVTLSAFEDGKLIYKELGEMLFTHFGISGPIVLSCSYKAVDYWQKTKEPLIGSIDFKPALTPEKLDARILRDFEENQNRDLENTLGALLPRSMIPVVLRRLEIDPEMQANSLTRQKRRTLVELLKAFSITITGKRPVAEAIITSGGVKVSEIDPKTMQSKIVPGLYFAGGRSCTLE